MKKALLMRAGFSALFSFGFAGPASAATGAFTVTKDHYPIYFDGSHSDTHHGYGTPAILPSAAIIANVGITVQSYANGFDAEYNGLSPRGNVVNRHTLHGGTYFATAAGRQDTVSVSYSY